MSPILVLAVVVLLVGGAKFLAGSRPLAWVLGLAALAAVAAGAVLLLRPTSVPTAPPAPAPAKSPAPATPAAAAAPAPAPDAPSGASVAGRVLRGESGEDPVAGASVEVFALDGGPVPFLAPLSKGESGADGRFRVGGLEKDRAYRVRGSQEGLASSVVHAGAGDDRVQIRLLAGTFVAGVVKDAETKQPVAGARVQVDDAVGTTTGPDGTYRLDRIPEGDTMVSATAPGYAEGHQYVKTGKRGKEGVVVLLSPASSVAGVVLDAAGAPAAGADVTVALFREIPMAGKVPAGRHEAKTGADGKFRVESLPIGQSLQVSARSEDGFAEPVDAGPLEKGKPVEGLVLRLSPAAVLVVTVLDDAGKPVAGVSVTAAHEEEKAQEAGDAEPAEADAGGEVAVPVARGFPARDGSSATTDEAGVARVRSVPPGRTLVSARKEDLVPAHQSHVVAVAAAETAVTLRLVAGSTVAGKVVDDLGKPVAGANVSVMRFEGGASVHESRTSGEDGSFRIGGLQGTGFQLNAVKAGHAPASVPSVDPAAGPVTVTLPRGGVVAGVVVDEGGGAVASFRASANRTDSGAAPDRMAMLGMAGMGASSFEDPSGRFRLEGLSAGTYTVEARAPEYAPGRSAEISVDAGATAEVRIVLPRGLSLHGIVVRKTGEAPVAGAKVSVAAPGPFGEMDFDFEAEKPTEDGEVAAEAAPEDAAASAGGAMAEAMGMAAGPAATTGPDGRFVLRGLEAGTVDLRVKAKDLAPALHKGVTVPAESEVRIALAEGASMEGTVYDAQRAPKSGAMVMLQRLPATMKMATTDAKGRYRIADVAPGNYIVYFMESADGMMNAGGGMNLKSESVTLEEGKTLVKDHRFGEGVRVTGRVTRGGKPVPNMMVMLIPGSGRKDATSAILGGGGFAMATTGEDGRYEITGLAPGVYTAMVQTGMGGGPAPGEPVEIAAGATEVRRDIVLSRNVVRGIVVDDAGKPVAQAQVVAIVTGRESARVADLGEAVASMGGQVMSGDDGRFSLEDVNPGSYTVKASAAGRSAAFAENVVPTEAGTEVRLVLAKGVDVTVRVVDAEGKPVSGAGIYLSDARGMDLSGMEMFDARRTGADGRIVVNAPQGTVRFEAVVRGHAPGMTTAATDSPEVVIALPRGATLEVIVTDAGGSPVAGVSIRLLDAAGSPYAPRMTMEGMGELMTAPATGADGKYVRADLPAGSYIVRAATGERTADAAVTLVGGEKKAAAIRLP